MALYGQNLADAVPDGCTYQQGTDICGLLETGLRAALAAMDGGLLVSLDAVIEGENLAGIVGDLNTELSGVLALDTMIQSMGGDPTTWAGQAMPPDYVQSLRSHVKTATSTLKTATQWFSLPSFAGVCDGIVAVCGQLASLIASAASKVVGNTLGGLWWVLLLAAGGLYLWRRGWQAPA